MFMSAICKIIVDIIVISTTWWKTFKLVRDVLRLHKGIGLSGTLLRDGNVLVICIGTNVTNCCALGSLYFM